MLRNLGIIHPAPGKRPGIPLLCILLTATLRGIGRRQVREAEEQAAMINSLMRVDPGLYCCLLDQKNEGETNSWLDTDEESSPDDDF